MWPKCRYEDKIFIGDPPEGSASVQCDEDAEWKIEFGPSNKDVIEGCTGHVGSLLRVYEFNRVTYMRK